MSYWTVIVCIVSAFIILIAKMSRKSKNLPPGPPGLPFIGNLHQLGLKTHSSLFDLSKKYGPIMFIKLGNIPTVVISAPETAKQVLKTYDVECCTRPHLTCPERLTYDFKDLAFGPYNEYWREMRKMCVLELYTAKRVSSFRHIREEEVESFVDFVKKSADSSTLVNLNEKFMSLSGSVICRIGFGMNIRGTKLGDKYEKVTREAVEVMGSFAAADFFPYLGPIIDKLTGLKGRVEKVFQELDEFYEQAIQHHIEDEREDGEEDVIDILLKMEKEGRGRGQGQGQFQLTRNHIKGILVNILLAGIDTSAQAMAWVMTHLISNPNVMKKLQTHLREEIKNKDSIDGDDIEKLGYLNMVIKETFRINPVGPFLIPREAMKDMKINGFDIPRKTRIQVNLWAIHGSPEIWKDPERFVPERFMDNQVDFKGHHFELLPFGSGRRMCPGMGMGMSLVHLTLMNLLYRFDWKLPEGMKVEDVDLEEMYGLVAYKKVPLQLVPILTQWT